MGRTHETPGALPHNSELAGLGVSSTRNKNRGALDKRLAQAARLLSFGFGRRQDAHPALAVEQAETEQELRPGKDADVSDSAPSNTHLHHTNRVPRARLRWAAGLTTLILAAPGVVALTGEGNSSGSITSIEVPWGNHWDKVPSNYDAPVQAAGTICPGLISSRTVIGVATVEDGPVFNWNPYVESPAKAKGAMQFEDGTWAWALAINPYTDRQNIPGFWAGSPYDVPTAIHNGAEYLCYLAKIHNGDEDATLEAYNGGKPGYAAEVEGVADNAVIDYAPNSSGGSSNAGSHPHPLSNSEKARILRKEGYTNISVHGGEGSGTFGKKCPTVIFDVSGDGTFRLHAFDLYPKDYRKVIWPRGTDPSAAEVIRLNGRLCGHY